jgi:hypothetical protein
MNETEKCKIRLAHWKDHNADHVKGYEEVARVLDELEVPKAAEMIRRGICFVEAANVEFEKALKSIDSAAVPAGAAPVQSEAGSGHVHIHGHQHEHEHSHDHSHDHSHAETHEHGHQHEHCGDHHHHHHTSGPDAHSRSDKD